MKVLSSSRLFRFGLFEADLDNARLTRKGVRVRLQELPFRILAMLLERSGQLVTREDLRQELWPSGTYVDFDGSLNAALKRLRAALDDDADNPRFIETIPKRGYRFIAPVTPETPTALAEPSIAPLPASDANDAKALINRHPPSSGFLLRRWRIMFGAAAAILALAVAGFLAVSKRPAHLLASRAESNIDIATLRRSVAVLSFQNASGRPGDAWLSTALAEMLRTELGAGGKLRVVPGETVAQFRANSSWFETDSLSRQTASQIGKALDGDLLVLGSFATLGGPEDGSVRVDFRLQDAQTGEILYQGAESGSEKQFFGLVAKIGVALRERLGLPMVTESEEVNVVSSLPADLQANRFYSLGLAKHREEDPAAAKDLFLQAEQIAPNFPLVHLMLSREWGALGYDQKSRAEAKKAFDLSSSLPETDKLLVQGAYYYSLHDKDKAVAVFRALFSINPDSLDYGLDLFNALYAAGRNEEGLAVIRQLRKLPAPASDNPRIDLAQSLALAGTSPQEHASFLESAIAKASRQNQKLLYARLRSYQCIDEVYGRRPQEGVAHCQEAYDILMAAGNRLLAADALRTMGDRRGAEGDFSGAREIYQHALAILTPLGEHEKTGVVLNNMADTYETQGQIGQAEKLYRQAAKTWKECGDTLHEAMALGNVAWIFLLRGQLPQAEEQFQNVRKQIDASGSNDFVGELYSIARIRLFEGDISGARQYAEQGMVLARARDSVTDTTAAGAILGDVQRAAGDLPGARQSYEHALAVNQQLGHRRELAQNQAAIASIAIEEGKFPEAEDSLRKSLTEFHAEHATMDDASAETELARGLLREGKLAEARETISGALALSASGPDPSVRLPAAIQDARIEAAELISRAKPKSKVDFSEPRRKLLHVLSTAHQLGYYSIQCDARLALAEIELRLNPPAARAHLNELVQDAHHHGMDLVSRNAAALADSSTALLEKARAE